MTKRHAFDQHILTTIRLNEHRPQETAFAEDTLADRRAFGNVFVECRARLALFRIALLPATTGASFPRPPMLAVGVAIDDTRAGDGDVLLFEGVNERRVAHQL